MKKFKFLVAFFTMLAMFVSFNGNAQELLPAAKALSIVVNEVETLKQNKFAATANATQAQREATVNALKIVVGESMLEDLKNGRDTSSALANSLSKISSNNADRQSMINEAADHYRNLLRKPF